MPFLVPERSVIDVAIAIATPFEPGCARKHVAWGGIGRGCLHCHCHDQWGGSFRVLLLLQVLEARGNAIAALPFTVSNLTALQRIMLELNQLTALPASICTLGHLTNLYLAYNQLTALPECIGQIATLRDIWLRGNAIPMLPASFCDLRMLSSVYIMGAGISQLPDCFGRVGEHASRIDVFLDENNLSTLPASMADMFTQGAGRLRSLELAGNRLTQLPGWLGPHIASLVSINVERNQIRGLPDASTLPPGLASLRLGGNPLNGASPQLRQTLASYLERSPGLTTLSLAFAPGGSGAAGWDGLANDYVVTAFGDDRGSIVPQGGRARCHARTCPFVIQTDWNSDAYASGGLGLHYCLNSSTGSVGGNGTTMEASCGCDTGAGQPPHPPTCIPLVDNHDGTYSGAIDARAVGGRRLASFRLFQRLTNSSAAFASGQLHEVVVGMWADGTECVGAKPGLDFQSRGGNCFRDVLFVPDCSPHGPFAVPVENVANNTAACQCPSGFLKTPLRDGTGRWQCNAAVPTAAAAAAVHRGQGLAAPASLFLTLLCGAVLGVAAREVAASLLLPPATSKAQQRGADEARVLR